MKPQATLNFTLATAGHVDHGKTSLLRALTGIDPDRLKEEKEREMTTDIGFAHLRVPFPDLAEESEKLPGMFRAFVSSDKTRNQDDVVVGEESELVVGFVDVPGHGKFLKNMLAGVGGIDMALLVVAADEGCMPQTIQHVKIVSLLGIDKAILVLTKTDLVSEDQLELSRQDAHELLPRFGIEVLETVCVSNTRKEGIEDVRAAILSQVLSARVPNKRFDRVGNPVPAFLPIDRVFTKTGYGAVVTGTLVAGEIRVGDSIYIEPGDIAGRVRGLETFNKQLQMALPGQRLAVNISLKDNKSMARGHVVMGRKTRTTRNLIVNLSDLGGIESVVDRKSRQLKPQAIRFYLGTAEIAGAVRWLQPIQTENGSGESLVGQIYLKEPIVAEPGQNCIVRYGDYGIAGGKILLTARPRWLTRELLVRLSQALLNGDAASALTEYMDASPTRALPDQELSCLLSPYEVAAQIDRLVEGETVVRLGGLSITRQELQRLSDLIVSFLERRSDLPADERAYSQESIRVKVAPLMERTVFQKIVADLIDSGSIVKKDDKLDLPREEESAVPDWLSDIAEKLLAELENEVCLEISELANRVGVDSKRVDEVLKHLSESKKAVIVNYDFVSSAEAIDDAHSRLAQIWNQKRNISPSDFRQAVGTSRKYAMALLAHFDDQKVTRRLQSGRVLLKAPERTSS